jgi:ribosome biogenesis GTPase
MMNREKERSRSFFVYIPFFYNPYEVQAMIRNILTVLGWDRLGIPADISFNNQSLRPYRVIHVLRGEYTVMGAGGERSAVLSGTFYAGDGPFPAVGDWVICREVDSSGDVIIQEVLPRKNHISRKTAGKRIEEQVIAANIDFLFIVHGVDTLKLNSIERYRLLAESSRIKPIIILNKADLAGADEAETQLRKRFSDVSCHRVSAQTGEGVDALRNIFSEGVTACFAGPSGAGKSSLINLLSEHPIQTVAEVRQSDSKGKHTTTSRQLFLLPGGGMVIDTPGMRELMPWDGSGLGAAFSEINQLASGCRFLDCRHEREPGCAVRRAVEEGTLDREKYENYRRLVKESAYLDSLKDEQARLERKRREKELGRAIKKYNQNREKYP